MDKRATMDQKKLKPPKVIRLISGFDDLLENLFSSGRFILVNLVEISALIVYVFINLVLPGRVPAGSSMYFIQPLLWLSLGCLAWLGWRYGLKNRPGSNPALLSMVILLAFFQIAILFLVGLVFGFGHSPYSHRFFDVLGNLFYVVAMLAGIELTRAYLIVLLGRRHFWLRFDCHAIIIILNHAAEHDPQFG